MQIATRSGKRRKTGAVINGLNMLQVAESPDRAAGIISIAETYVELQLTM